MLHPVLAPASRKHALDQWTRLAVVVTGALLLFVNLAVSEYPVGTTGMSYFLVFAAPAVIILGIAMAMKLRSQTLPEPPSRALIIAASGFGLMLAWAGLTMILSRHWVSVEFGDPSTVVPVPLSHVLSPLVTSGLTCLLALLAVNLVHITDLFRITWGFAIAGAVGTPIFAAWNAAFTDLYGRLATRLGGAAVLHTALLLGLAVCVGAALQGYRRWLSAIAAVLYLVSFLATGSRAGLISLGVFLVLALGPGLLLSARNRPSRLPLLIGGTLIGLAAFTMVAIQLLQSRGVDRSGGGRTDTWFYGLDQTLSSLHSLVFGVGYGVLWPWYGFEAKVLPQPGAHGDKQMPDGTTLSHAHNLYVAVFAEQGLIGLALLLVVVAVTLWAWWRSRGAVELTLAAALAAGLVSFAFDTYLIKNFPVSFVWWSCLAVLLALQKHRRAISEAR